MEQVEAGLQICVEQVEQEQGGLQIDVEQVEQGQGVGPAGPLHLTQNGTTRPWNGPWRFGCSNFTSKNVIYVVHVLVKRSKTFKNTCS